MIEFTEVEKKENDKTRKFTVECDDEIECMWFRQHMKIIGGVELQ